MFALLLDGKDEQARDEFLTELNGPAGPSPETVAAIEAYKQATEVAAGDVAS